MKRILLFLAVSLFTGVSSLLAENRTVVEGRCWNYVVLGTMGATTSNNHRYVAKGYHFEGIITLEGMEYNIFRDDNGKEVAYMREEDRKVYLYSNREDVSGLGFEVSTDQAEVMLYNFNCMEGDRFTSVGFDDMASHSGIPFDAEVISTGETTYGGNDFLYQDIRLSGEDGNNDAIRFTESLGCQNGLLPFPQFGNLTSGMRNEYEILLSVTDTDGTVIYKNTALAESLNGNIPTDLEWQYFEAYGTMASRANRVYDGRVVNYSMKPTEDEKYSYAWTCTGYTQWHHEGDRNDWPWEYKGNTEMNEPRAYLREEDGKVYISLESLNLAKEEPYVWFGGREGLGLYDPETDTTVPYTPSPGEEVVLYDYTAKVGDRYRTLILGSLICDVTVASVTESDMLPEEERISGAGKLIEIVADYDPYDFAKIKYAQGIGNIGTGDYLFLSAGTPKYETDDGTDGIWLLNNIYNEDGTIFYKGYDFAGFSGIKDIHVNDDQNGTIYDLHGRAVANPVPGSIYIRNGKKYVAE